MSVQFLVDVSDQPKYRTHMVLPNLFNERIYTGNPFLYLISNRGTKHKVWLMRVRSSPNYKLYSREWKTFVTHSRYDLVKTFHFIRQAPDEFYVTAYLNDGRECNGYNLQQFGFRLRRCLFTIQNLNESPIIPEALFTYPLDGRLRVLVGNVLVSTVRQRFVSRGPNEVGYILSGQEWDVLVYVERIVVGQRIVFTYTHNDSISLVSFSANGMNVKLERVPRMPLNLRFPFMRCLTDNDPRMKHECAWEGHEGFHDDEADVFYAPVLAYVVDSNRLTIPEKFVKAHRLRQYHNAFLNYDEEEFYVDLNWVYHAENPSRMNHMYINHRWRDIMEECDFEANKMIRFKLIGTFVDQNQTVDPLQPVMIPLFHMC